jgi:hypothetical protein
VIEFDEFEGAMVSLKYPEEIEIPINAIQQIHVSHTFSPGIIFLREQDLNAVTYGNEENAKIVVLLLDKYEDGEDFREIIDILNNVLRENEDVELLSGELERIYTMSQKVFKAREAVLDKMAKEIQELKNKELDINAGLRYLMKNEVNHLYRPIHALMLLGPLSLSKIIEYTSLEQEELLPILSELENMNYIENRDGHYHLLIMYY